jgi:uncharacterized membrane protein
MLTPASIARHPLHPMLVVFPIALWVFSLACDVLSLIGAAGSRWSDLAFYSMVAGLIGALAAAVPGLIDYVSVWRSRVHRLATAHMILNLVAVALFAVSVWLRVRGGHGSLAVALSAVGVVVIVVSGWLGGEMVYVHGIGVAPAATAHTAGTPARGPAASPRPAGSSSRRSP